VQLGQRIATLAMRARSPRAVRSMLAVLVLGVAGGATLLVFNGAADLAPALEAAPAQAPGENRFSDPRESD
jgi:hypothetical protein